MAEEEPDDKKDEQEKKKPIIDMDDPFAQPEHVNKLISENVKMKYEIQELQDEITSLKGKKTSKEKWSEKEIQELKDQLKEAQKPKEPTPPTEEEIKQEEEKKEENRKKNFFSGFFSATFAAQVFNWRFSFVHGLIFLMMGIINVFSYLSLKRESKKCTRKPRVTKILIVIRLTFCSIFFLFFSVISRVYYSKSFQTERVWKQGYSFFSTKSDIQEAKNMITPL